MSQPIHALNLFNVSNKDEYLAYSRRSAKEVKAHGGRTLALGKFREAAAGDIGPRNILIVAEWASMDAFDSYCNDPDLADLHPHRVNPAPNHCKEIPLPSFRATRTLLNSCVRIAPTNARLGEKGRSSSRYSNRLPLALL
jgi:uncharacterized protein (DUF1330 family)